MPNPKSGIKLFDITAHRHSAGQSRHCLTRQLGSDVLTGRFALDAMDNANIPSLAVFDRSMR